MRTSDKNNRHSSITAWRHALAALSAVILVVLSAATTQAARVSDMAGRGVTVPSRINRVWSAYPPLTYLIYALDPSLLVGWNFPPAGVSRPFIAERYRDLPTVGGWFGQRTPNMEALITARPDVALVWDQSLRALPGMEQRLRKLSIPVVAVKLERISEYPDSILFLGNLLERRKRARELAAAVAGSVADMKKFAAAIPANARRSVFYAIGPDGLNSDCNHMPFLEEAIGLAGARSAHGCNGREEPGNRLNMELVLKYNPDVIITQDDTFYHAVFSDRRWQGLAAVRERRVYRIPAIPFNWLNFPPSFMRALGIKWLASVVYPERFKPDMRRETERFYRLFLNISLTRGQIDKILSP